MNRQELGNELARRLYKPRVLCLDKILKIKPEHSNKKRKGKKNINFVEFSLAVSLG